MFSLPLRVERKIVGVLALAYPIPSRATRCLPDRWPSLTPRRYQVLRLLGEGLGTAEIAHELVLSEQTVRNHVRDVLRDLDAHSRLEAVDIARRLGLLGLAAESQ
jgi:DNA-binding NarL/FixJ family response regulator